MAIYYAGEPLLLEDIGGEAKCWLDRYLPFEEVNLFGQPTVFASGERTNSRSGCKDPVSLPIPNYPPPPPLKINSLYWPTGATRWARFVGLATESAKDAIIDAVTDVDDRISQAYLTISANPRHFTSTPQGFGQHTIITEMYLLPPRPVSEVDRIHSQSETLWLIPLVDVRYYWQYRHVGEFEPATWDAAFTSLDTALGLTQGLTSKLETSAISSAYDIPSPAEHWRHYANAAYMLDAVAWSIGHRITRHVDGQVISESANDALDMVKDNLPTGKLDDLDKWAQTAGGGIFSPDNRSASGAIPERVLVTFRDSSGEIAGTVTELAVNHSFTGYVPDLVKVIHTNFPWDAEDENDPTAMKELATQIASDYYAWHSHRYDRTFIGIKTWNPSGFDDYVEWSIGRRRSDGTYEAQTRVQTVPYNFGVDEQPQKGEECSSDGVQIIRFEIDSVSNCVECHANATVLSRPPGVSQVTGEDAYSGVRVYDYAGCWLNAPEDDLVGMMGYAVLLKGATPLECDPPDGDEVTRIGTRWEIMSLCCTQRSCGD